MCGKISNHIESKSIQYKPVSTDFSLSKIKIQPLGQNMISSKVPNKEEMPISNSSSIQNIEKMSDVQRITKIQQQKSAEIEKLSIGEFLEEGFEEFKSGILGAFGSQTEKDEAMYYFGYNGLCNIEKSDIAKITNRGPSGENMGVELKNGNLYIFDKNTKKVKFLKLRDGEEYTFDEDGDIIGSSSEAASDIFGDHYPYHVPYGGNQSVFRDDVDALLEDNEIYRFITSEFPNATEEDYRLYMMKICNVGCGYVALINSVFEQFVGREEKFKEIFGFPMYKLSENNEIIFNYELLILRYFTYVWHDYYGYENIEDIYGNVSEGVNDGAISGDITTGATGHNAETYPIFESFLKDTYGFESDVTVINKVPTYENFLQAREEGKSIICGTGGYDLYKIDPNTGEKGSIYMEDGGGHAMTITGFTDQGDMIVSSWGKKYILDISNASYIRYIVVDV